MLGISRWSGFQKAIYLHVCGQVWMARVRCLPLVFGFDSQMHLRLHVCDPNMDSQSDDAWRQSLVRIPDCNYVCAYITKYDSRLQSCLHVCVRVRVARVRMRGIGRWLGFQNAVLLACMSLWPNMDNQRENDCISRGLGFQGIWLTVRLCTIHLGDAMRCGASVLARTPCAALCKA